MAYLKMNKYKVLISTPLFHIGGITTHIFSLIKIFKKIITILL